MFRVSCLGFAQIGVECVTYRGLGCEVSLCFSEQIPREEMLTSNKHLHKSTGQQSL